MTDLFATPPPKPGVANGAFLGHLANAQDRGEPIHAIAADLRARHKRGELDGLNTDYAAQWLSEAGLTKETTR